MSRFVPSVNCRSLHSTSFARCVWLYGNLHINFLPNTEKISLKYKRRPSGETIFVAVVEFQT